MSAHDESTPDEHTVHPEAPPAPAAERVARSVVAIGRLWAAHGLSIGRSALETSAVTLRTTADLLGELSQRFEPRAEDDAA